MPSLRQLSSRIPKPPMPGWMKNPKHQARGYSYVNLVIHVYQLYSFWFDVEQFGQVFLYSLIFCVFVLLPVCLGFLLLIAVHKRQLKRIGIWWICEIILLLLNLNLFIVGLYGISWKTMINFILHGGLRVFGLYVVYLYMIQLDFDEGYGINQVGAGQDEFREVPLGDPWSGEENM